MNTKVNKIFISNFCRNLGREAREKQRECCQSPMIHTQSRIEYTILSLFQITLQRTKVGHMITAALFFSFSPFLIHSYLNVVTQVRTRNPKLINRRSLEFDFENSRVGFKRIKLDCPPLYSRYSLKVLSHEPFEGIVERAHEAPLVTLPQPTPSQGARTTHPRAAWLSASTKPPLETLSQPTPAPGARNKPSEGGMVEREH